MNPKVAFQDSVTTLLTPFLMQDANILDKYFNLVTMEDVFPNTT